MKLGSIYKFSELENYLSQLDNKRKYFILFDVNDKSSAVMHVFHEHFCGDWRSGDGVLFYDNTETHSADEDQKFKLIEIREF